MSTGVLALAHGDLTLPAFLPDATLGVVRAVDSSDLLAAGVEAVVMNVFHLMQKPGSSTIAALGGLHGMADWPRPIITDSGGFQAYSLLRQNPKFGKISDQGIRFTPEGSDRTFLLTPEKSVQLQMAYGADVVICLDDCTHVDAPDSEQRASVARTIRWAKRCKEEFTRQLLNHRDTETRRIHGEKQEKSHKEKEVRAGGRLAAERGFSPAANADGGSGPLLFGVVQGGGDLDLRRQCAEALLEIGFDGYGYGGWPLDSGGNLLVEMLAHTRALIPAAFPMHALGVGHPENVTACARLGYQLFDSALPTRDARNGRLYVFRDDPNGGSLRLTGDWFSMLYIDDDKHIKNQKPISPGCDCHTCRKYAVGYLRHLHKSGDTLFFRLATIHNLRFMMQLMALLRQET